MNKQYIKKLQKFGKQLKILYVEDNEEARYSNTELLKIFFSDIVIAVNGEDGLKKFKENQKEIKLVITDINMPKMNGLDMISHIKQLNPNIYVIVISAFNEANYLIKSIKIQVDDYLLKPIQTKTFIPIIAKVIHNIKLEYENKQYKDKLEQLVKQQIKEIEHQNKIIFQQSKLAAMGEMIDSIAHQWKQPLGVISTYTQNMEIQLEILKKVNIEDVNKCIVNVKKQIDHLLSTIDEFRDFFRPELKISTVNVKEIINSVIVLIKDELIKNNIDIELDLSNDTSIDIIKNEFKHILLNIINNAKDAFDKSNNNKLIKIFIKDDEYYTSIHIEDNAGGIPTDVIDHIFEANYTTKKELNGTGMGLYMSRLIIEKINGKLIAQNIDQGAKFIIKIPKNII